MRFGSNIILRDAAGFLTGSSLVQLYRTMRMASVKLALHGEIGVTIVDDERMVQFGHGPTDVLAFPYSRHGPEIGDVFINKNYVQRIRKNSLWLARSEELAVHAFVHLAGHTHDTFESYNEMRRVEIQVLGRPCLPNWEKRVEY